MASYLPGGLGGTRFAPSAQTSASSRFVQMPFPGAAAGLQQTFPAEFPAEFS